MLTQDELDARLADTDPNRRWFLNVSSGEIKDSIGEGVIVLRAHPAVWVEVPRELAQALQSIEPSRRAEALRQTSATE